MDVIIIYVIIIDYYQMQAANDIFWNNYKVN